MERKKMISVVRIKNDIRDQSLIYKGNKAQ